jgi:ABC-type glycerol-3-phosphate transport system substrate-binding protein
LLNLDPFTSTDVDFSEDDVIGNALEQLQRDNKLWGLPIAIQPTLLSYDSEQFARAGVPAPVDGWTTDAFVDALYALKTSPDDPAPFVSASPGSNDLLMLIAAFGGLPIDYRTDPATINFTDPATIDAIRQVLDLAKAGYLEYQQLATGAFVVSVGGEQTAAITTDNSSLFAFGRPRFQGQDSESSSDPYRLTTYPRGSQYGVISYSGMAGFVSANAQNPEACYRWLNALARNPSLFSGIPARRSVMNDPAVVATQGEDRVAVFNQLDALMQDPNTIVFPSLFRQGGSPTEFALEFWLGRAFDNYVLQDADLETELAAAQMYVDDYQACVASLPPFDPSAPGQGYFAQVIGCITSVDPTYPAPGAD